VTQLITLLTDFGTADPFVGTMKGVIAGICPDARVVDITHEVAPQDIASAAFFLERSFRFFPNGTVHVAVVDPGVGTARAPLAIAANGHLFVGPDNGVLSLAAPRGRAVRITRREYVRATVSHTIHGRDVFAPVAAHLACGAPIERLGPRKARYVKLPSPRPRRTSRGFAGRILSVDRFGNLITSFEPVDWNALARPRLVVGDVTIGELCATYAAAPLGALLAVFGGYGLLEIAVRNGSAASKLGIGAGAVVRLESRPR
jgi:S-adenosylmethionine hydrolase